ncbi:MAG: methyltransferase domain-containing protein [Hyphomicrobium sp.]
MRTRFTRFHLSDGTAECTRLLDASIDMVVAATAFHWFDAEQTRREFRRILKPGGYALLLWNERRSDSSPFLRAYEDLSQRFGTDYKKRGSERKNLVHQLDAFFGGPFQTRRLENPRQLDFNGVRERLLSASYSPLPGEPNHDEMMGVLREIFDHHQQAGHITFEYETVMYWRRSREKRPSPCLRTHPHLNPQ